MLWNAADAVTSRAMDKRTLGETSIAITPLMLGGNVFGWTADEATSFAILDAFVAQGGNSIDTADVYSAWAPGHEGGESETVIGKWLKRSGKRNAVVIGTKVGMLEKRKGLERDNIVAACEDSLRRLGVEAIDLYWIHRDDEAIPPAEYVGALDELVRAGKVRATGASNFTAPRLAAALAESDRTGRARSGPSRSGLHPPPAQAQVPLLHRAAAPRASCVRDPSPVPLPMPDPEARRH